MKDNTTVVFNGFLQLPNLEKLDLVNAINDYFDSNDREAIRTSAEENFTKMDRSASDFKCPCCGR